MKKRRQVTLLIAVMMLISSLAISANEDLKLNMSDYKSGATEYLSENGF